MFEQAYYSAPYRLVGQMLRVRAGVDRVRVYTSNYQLVATHPRAIQAGERQTNHAHLPPTHLEGLVMTREMCQTTATDIGTATAATVTAILADSVVDRLPTARRLLQLRDRYGDHQLEAACHRAVQFGDPAYSTVKRILEQGATGTLNAETTTPPPATTFVRKASELLGQLGGLQWN